MSRHPSAYPGYDENPQHLRRWVLYVLMLVIAIAFAGFVWQLYGAGEAPLIAAQSSPHNAAPGPGAAPAPGFGEFNALTQAEGIDTAPAAPAPAGPQQPAELAQAHFVSDGPYVAQVAALRSQDAAGIAWRRLSSRAPDLFAPAHVDVARADLGQRGVFYRLRAGYFTDRTSGERFCASLRQIGEACFVAAR